MQRPTGHILDGESIVPVIRSDDGKLKREAIFWHFPCYLPGRGGFRITPSSVVRQGDWKLTEHFEDGRLELYNLAEDLGETRDLAAEKPKKARELKQRLDEWHKRVGAKIPTQPNPKYDPNA